MKKAHKLGLILLCGMFLLNVPVYAISGPSRTPNPVQRNSIPTPAPTPDRLRSFAKAVRQHIENEIIDQIELEKFQRDETEKCFKTGDPGACFDAATVINFWDIEQ